MAGDYRGRLRALPFIAAALLLAVHLASVPMTIWEFDEPFFAMAVEKYEPLLHHPPPPGYPLFIGFAKLLSPLFGRPFDVLRAISILATIGGLAAWAWALRSVLAAVLLYASPAMLVHATLPQSDSMAMALLGLSVALLPAARGEGGAERRLRGPLLFALACAATIGWRLQFSIAVVPLFLTTLVLMRTWRARVIATLTFGLACLAWLVPLVMATGGVASFRGWLGGQAAYFAAHDADLSRSGTSAIQLAFRFIAHPWGPKWLSFAVLLCAAVGVVIVIRKRMLTALPLLVMTAVYLGFALVTMDPADAVRYVLPTLPCVAFLAIMAFEVDRLKPVALLFVLAFAVGAVMYTLPVLRQRRATPSPPVAAIQHLRRVAPRNAVILYDLPLRPHADYLLRGFRRMRVDEGLLRFGHRLDVPLFILADGETEGTVFRWESSDAYRKLTRNFYSVVTVAPVPASERFQAVSGIYPPERSRDGKSWRWVAAEGVLRLPDIDATHVRLTFRLPPEYPFEGNVIRIGNQTLALRRDQSADMIVPSAELIRIVPERTFVPAQIAGRNNRDRRTLSVMLTDVEQIGARAIAQ